MTEAPKPILILIALVALAAICGSAYVGYYAMTTPATYDHPAVATAPAQPAAPVQPAPATAPAQPHT